MNLMYHYDASPLPRSWTERDVRRCRLTGIDISVPLTATIEGGRGGGAPESVIARGLVPPDAGLLVLLVATGEGREPFLEAV